ncbi:MAG: deoxyuridine 5'-triphosphate nucleotidohydrolase [Candidatus Micrarchaeia archaeon]
MIFPKQSLFSFISEHIADSQFQPAGVDITLNKVLSFSSPGHIDFDNSERRISETVEVPFREGWAELREGAYKVIFNEYVNIPRDAAAFCFPRSSLLRSGITLECAVWDPGYEGRSEALLLVKNLHGARLKKNARIGQLVFARLSEPSTDSYEGIYKGENR